MRRIGLALLGPMLFASCATITTGRYEDLRVTSSPSQADATRMCEGRPSGQGATPVTFRIRRNAGDCILTLRKEGFEEKAISMEQGVNPAYWSNMLFSWVPPLGAWVTVLGDSGEKVIGVGLLGAGLAIFGTDFWTGAVHAHKPHDIDAVLKPK